MKYKEDFIFWRLAYFFISDQDYRIVQLFENQQELWLEKLESKHAQIIRIFKHQIDWSNMIQRDIEFTAANGERIRRQLALRELNVVNIYVSPYPPVDDYEFRLAKSFVLPEGNKTKVTSFLMTSGEYEAGFERLAEWVDKEINFPIKDEYTQLEVDAVKNSTLENAQKKKQLEKEEASSIKPIFTFAFILIQVAVFFWLETHGGSTNTNTLIKYGAKFNPLIYEGEWWRFLTPVFLHIGFMHLAMNTLALYYLGIAVERLYGNGRFLFIYLFAGISGFIASFIFSSTLSAGASGAIFGCLGALVYLCTINSKLFFQTMGMNVIFVLIINLAFGFISTGIDNAGHLGGLVGGFLAAGIVQPKRKKPLMQLLFLIIATIIVWSALTYGFSTQAKANDEGSNLILAQNYITNDQFDQAYNTLKNVEKRSENPSAQVYFLLSFTEIKKGMLPNARAHLQKAIKLEPKFHEAYYNLALIYLEENDYIRAKKYAEKASRLKPEQKKYANLVNEINGHIPSSDGGL
ncbi:rhomboid family intramembrane serine protease [Neobacillus sp. PS3-40]|uniref:rhomboid family intramembrane serine protease n=1 Tax=Neobacillus sp. PS3-40 TaxID=3070679 RepID=UPI0027E20B34|nr:rhomboid family intramembrane serine protease [Neobacillus sp. PS3-40]WML45307.1 rhomboid family intramembrane serine protease [Neobacillus sp. PS3-40]